MLISNTKKNVITILAYRLSDYVINYYNYYYYYTFSISQYTNRYN